MLVKVQAEEPEQTLNFSISKIRQQRNFRFWLDMVTLKVKPDTSKAPASQSQSQLHGPKEEPSFYRELLEIVSEEVQPIFWKDFLLHGQTPSSF